MHCQPVFKQVCCRCRQIISNAILYVYHPPSLTNKIHFLQARSQGGGGGSGGSYDPPPPVAHPKDFVPPFSNFVPPFSNFVPPFSNFVPPFSNFVPPFSNFVPPFSNFVPPFSNFVPPLEYVDWMTSHGQCPRGGGACECPREWGRFSN